jgi:hypothetical protein
MAKVRISRVICLPAVQGVGGFALPWREEVDQEIPFHHYKSR